MRINAITTTTIRVYHSKLGKEKKINSKVIRCNEIVGRRKENYEIKNRNSINKSTRNKAICFKTLLQLINFYTI